MKTLGVAAFAVAALSGCAPDYVTQNDSNVLLVIRGITGQNGGGGTGSGIGSVLLSDVRGDKGTFNDNASIEVAVIAKNPRVITPGPVNDVFLDQYQVRFLRTDGLNREGIDVPFSFSGPMALLVAAGGQGSASIIIVRHAAKFEPPLANLTGAGGFGLLTTFAEITIFGHTTSGKAVQATGRLEVHFIDFVG